MALSTVLFDVHLTFVYHINVANLELLNLALSVFLILARCGENRAKTNKRMKNFIAVNPSIMGFDDISIEEEIANAKEAQAYEWEREEGNVYGV